MLASSGRGPDSCLDQDMMNVLVIVEGAEDPVLGFDELVG